MGIVAHLVVGLITGRLARMVMGGRGCGVLGNIAVGVIGAPLSGLIGSALFGWDVTGVDAGSIVVAFLCTVLFLLILRMIPGTRPLER